MGQARDSSCAPRCMSGTSARKVPRDPFPLPSQDAESFDRSLEGDFNLENNLINKNDKNNLNYIYTGLQIIKPNVFSDIKEKVFSINKIWDSLIINNELHALESKNDFLHVSTLNIYKSLLKKI